MSKKLKNKKGWHPLWGVFINIFLPSFILIQSSQHQWLSVQATLIVALSLPLTYGFIEVLHQKKLQYLPLIGIVNILATAAVCLGGLSPHWVAVKEGVIPGIIGIIVLITAKTKKPFFKEILYHQSVIDIGRIESMIEDKANHEAYEKLLRSTARLVALSYFIAMVLNYELCRFTVTSPTNTAEFNIELGIFTIVAYIVVFLPSMAVMMFSFWRLLQDLEKLTHIKWTEMLQPRTTIK